MFKYLINDQEVTFNSEEERLKGIAEAEANDYSIELLEEPEFKTSDAPESAFSQVISGEVPEIEEDFIQDPAKSADAVSETVAQEDTELLLDDGSTELPSGEDYSIDGKPVTKKEYEIYDAEVNADKPLELTLSKEDYEFNQGIQKKLNKTPPPPEWDFWSETGTKIQAATTRSLGKLARIPIFLKEMQFAYSKAFLSEEEQARIDALPPKVQQAMALMSGGGSFSSASMVKVATMGLEKYEESVIKAKKIEETLTKFDTTIVDQYAAGNFTEATVRTISDALGSIPSVAQAMIPYVGIASIVAGEAAGASGEVQEEGEGISAKTMGYSLVRGASEGLLELTTKKIGKGLFKSLTGKPKDIVVKELKDIALGVGKEYGQEGLSESATLTINTAADLLILGREDAFDGYLEELGDTFLVGAAMGGGMSGSGAGISIVKQGIQAKKINKQLKETDYKNLTDAYRTTEVPDALVNLSLNPAVQSFLNKDLDNKVKSGDITTEESDNIKRNFADMQGAAKAVNASTISDTNAGEAVELLTEKTRLEADIKTIGDKSLSGPQQLRVDTIKTLLDKLAGQGVLEAKTKKADAILKQLGGKGVVEVGNEKQMAAKFDQINKEDQKLHDDAQQKAIEAGEKTFKVGETEFSVDSQYKSNAQEFGGYGTYVPRLDGTAEVIINKAVAFEDGMVNTAAHEVLHYALRETLKSTVAQKKTGTALLDFVNSIEATEDIKDNEFTRRLKQYKDDARITEGDTQEEVLTLLSEAMLDGKLKFNETMSTKLLDFGRRLLSSMGFASVKFNTGKDVFNFIKDYNRSINKGKLDKGLKGSLKKGIKGKLTDSTIKDQPKKKQSAKPSLTTNKVDTALDALEEAEALRDEDFDNPTLAANVEKALAVYNQAVIEFENLDADAIIETAEEATKEKIVRPKADKTKRRYSLDADAKKEIEPKIAEAQAMNKKLIAQEKELNKKLIADIEAIPDKEVKRTEKDKRINALKNNPRRVAKSPALNKLEREISKELKTPIDKAVNLFTKLYYDKISDNAKTAVTRDEFKESARAEITSITINEFKPKTINRQGERVVNDIEDIIFQRGGLRLRSLAGRLGVVGKDQGIARGAEALIKMADSSSDINFDENDKDSIRSEEKRKVSALLASAARTEQAKQQVKEFWIENEGNTKVENFKKLPNLINNILAEMFGVTEGTLTARSGNLNKADYANAIKAFTEKQAVFTVKEGDTKKEVRVPVSEVSAFQDSLNEKKAENKDFSYKREPNESIAEALLRFLPQTSADDYTYASGRKGRFSGKSTGLPKNLMGLAYKIDGRKTTGIGNVERTAQKLTIEEIYDAIGAGFDAAGNVVQKMGLSGKNKEGQTMLGLIKLLGRMVTNELSRTETDLDPMTKMDIAAGKNRMMHSLRLPTQNEVILKANKDIENLKRVIDKVSADKYINDVRYIADILDSAELKIVNKTIFSSRSKLIAENVTRNNPEISKADAIKEGRKITKYIKEELDKLKEEGILNKRKTVPASKAGTQFPKAKFDGYVYAINSGALVDQNKKHAEVMRNSYLSIYNDIAKAKKSGNEEQLLQQIALWSRFTEAASMERTHFLPMGGANIGYEAGLSPKETKTFEHAFPVMDMGGKLLAAALDSDSKKEFIAKYNGFVKNYVIIGLSKNSANKVGKAGYNSTMPANSKFWWQRYLNPEVAAIKGGINPHNIFVRNDSGEIVTLSEYAGWVDNAGRPLTKKLKEFYQKQAKAQAKISEGNIKLMPKNLQVKVANVKNSLSITENFDKAITLGNSLDQPTRGISIWDFDDTLAKTKSNVLYTMPGAQSKVTEKEFNNLFKQKTVYYHGTSAVVDQKFVNKEIVKDFPEGASSFSVQMQGLGKHYTKSLDNAKSFIDHRNREDNTGTVAAVSISTNNPKQFKTYDELLNDIKSTVKNKDLSISERNKKYLDILKSEGFDSITYKEGPSYNPGKKSLMAEAVIPFDSAKKLIGSADYKQRNGGIVKESAVAVKQNKLNAEEFAKRGDELLAQGAEFDFSEFSKVMSGAKGPFFNKAVDRNKKFGNKDVYILTARPANSANAIHEFLKGIGLDIPLANITGLASSDPQAKANWVVSKFAEGYNDFYFADDHVGNVAAVGDALSRLDDVQSKVELAKAVKYSKKIRKEYSAILDKLRGGEVIEGNKAFSAEQQIDDVFDWVKSLDIPEKNQAKYKKAALNFVAKSPTNFPVDAEIVGEAMRIAELKKLNVMDFSNPRDIIDKFAGEVKAKRLDPNKEKQFFNKKSLPEGIETFQITTQRRGQQAVRRMLDTHWGEKANPWCVTVQEKTYTEAEKKELKINNPKYPIGTKDKMLGEEIMDKGVVIESANTAPTDFVGNLMPGWVEGPTTYASTNYLDQLIIDTETEQDFDEDLAQAKAQGYKVIEGSYDVDGDSFYVQMERNNDPKVNKVFKYTQYFKAIDPSLTQEEFNNGPAKGGTVYNPRIEATGPAELTPQSFQMWENYGKPAGPKRLFDMGVISATEFANEDTVDVESDDGGFEIAFKDGKLLALKNLGGTKQEWFDRMDHGTKDLALKVPRDAKGKINGKSTLMNTDSGRVFSKDYTIKYSKRIDRDINFLTNELSTKGEALPGQSTNLDAQPKAVKDVINTLDVKSKVQQARVKSSLQLSKRFNEIIEEESGIEAFKEYQSVKAAKKGAKKGKFKFFVPPSAEDFLGLLYTTLPKGKKGESAMAFYKEHLLDPYGKAVTGLRTGRITIAKNYKALKKELGIVPRTLKKNFKYEDENGNMKESLFTKEDAIRVYTWDAQGLDIPGLSNVDLPILVNYVNSNPDLKAFADKLLGLNKNTEPKAPTESWPAGTITSDLLNTLNTDGRKQLLEVWQQNVDAIFTPTNLNKLEAAYGKPYVTALKDSLRRMRTGRNSTPTNNGVTDGIVRWLNAAVGNIMFLNRRSAVLQLISFTNFINFEGNNLYQAGKAFANQPQYWKDWVYLMNSDYLVDRRDGLKINVNEADIATTAKENGFQGVLAKILQVGFTPTKYADSVAIATGGASFYRNRVNALVKGGMSKAAAEKQAMQDFVATAEVSQQSSDPSKISKQQAEPIGRIILAFANTPSQYARIIKRAAQDLKNGRGDAKAHLSRIVYYGVLQNVVFNFLQQAMFAAMFGDDEDESEEDTAAKSANNTKKAIKVANSMTDGILRGIGVAGAVVSVAKNLAIKLYERSQKTRNQNLAATIKDEVMKISPPISSKLSKAGKVGNAFEWGKKEIEFDEMSLKHPYVTAATNTVAALTGLPLDRAQGMAIDAADIASDETETWMKPLIALGWPKWQLMSEEDTKAEREEAKERFKGLKEDKEYNELNPTEKRRKALKDLNKKEQVDMLWNAGVSRTEIKSLSKEADRIDKLMDIQNKEQFDKDMEAISRGEEIGEPVKIEKPKKEKKKYSPAMEKRRKVLKDLSKQEQVDSLWNRGLSKSEIRELTSEESRINKIIELQNKKRKDSLK